MKKLIGAAVLFSVSQFGLQAAEPDQSPTFSNEVSRILQQKCQRCHQPGGIGPMPLETYEQVRVWAPLIRENVRRRVMPPWHLDPTIGIQEYKNDFSLSDKQIDILVAWVDNGTPEGDPADLPPPVDWPNWLEWETGTGIGRAGHGVRIGAHHSARRGRRFLAIDRR